MNASQYILAVLMDQTMNTHFLSPLQWITVLTGSTWAPIHPRKTLYKVPQGFSIPGKQFLMNSSQHLAIYTGSNHEYTLS